jgi:hypothetical protein
MVSIFDIFDGVAIATAKVVSAADIHLPAIL